jgi:hypothetical protein
MKFIGNLLNRLNFTRTTEIDVAVYVMQPDDTTLHVLRPSTSACTIILPTLAVNDNRLIYIFDASGNAGTNNITIDTQGSETINGAASIAIAANFGGARIYARGGNWFAWVS